MTQVDTSVAGETYFFETREGQELADLMSISHDLEQVIACSKLLVRRGDKQAFEPERVALIDSAVIRYRRCFITGVRMKLFESDVKNVAPAYMAIHKFFYDLGNKHIAHSVSALEHPHAFVALDKSDKQNPKVVAHGIMHMEGSVATSNFERLAELCEILRDQCVAVKVQDREPKFEQQVGELTPERLRKLKPAMVPVNLTEQQIGQQRWRAPEARAPKRP